MTGRTVYCGQFWIRRDYQAKRLARVFSRICQAMGLLRWSPNVTYALTKHDFAVRGFGVQIGFAHGQTHAIGWSELPRYMPTYHIIWNTLADLQWMIEQGHEANVVAVQTPKTPAPRAQTRSVG